MVAEVLFAGGRLDSLVVASGSPTESTTAAHRNGTYADAASVCGTTGTVIEAGFFTDASNILSAATVVSGETLWVHFDFYNLGTNFSTGVILSILNSANEPWFRIVSASGGVFTPQYNSGTGASPVWTAVGNSITIEGQTLFIFDLKLTMGSPHTFEFSLNSSLYSSGSFTQASFTAAAKARFAGSGGTSGSAYSQIFCTRDISTIGGRVKYNRATANGANTGWTNTFANVAEAVGSDATVQAAATAGLKSTHVMQDITLFGTLKVRSIFHWLRANHDGSTPVNIKSVLRSSGVDYATGNLSGFGATLAAVGARYDLDPATAAAWTVAGWNADEAGFEAAA